MAIHVRGVTAGDLPVLARLLAERQRRERRTLPQLGVRLTSADECFVSLRDASSSERVSGVVAESDGALTGFMFGEKMMLPPNAFPSMFVPPHSISIGVDRHAVAGDGDPTIVYRAMYAALAAKWVREGFFIHTLNITPADRAVQEAWVSLGFGRSTTAATRPTEQSVKGAAPANVEIHQAGPEDINIVMGLSDTLFIHHSQSPMFWPFLNEPKAAAREHTKGLLADPANAHFIAYADGKPAGMQTFMRPGFTPPVMDYDQDVYLFEGVVEAKARSGGVGTALLEHSMRWAQERGYTQCTLHFASGNPSGAPFWLGHGFVPIEYTMVRHVDERVAWANGWEK